MKTFAIVVVCYNRLAGLKRLLHSLLVADYTGRKDIDLVFSIDNSGTSVISDYANEFYWPYGQKKIRTFPTRQGLKNHILQCGDLTSQYDIISVFEDDVVVSNSFFAYAYSAANYYWSDDNIAGISLYGFQKNWLSWTFRFEPYRTGFDSYFMKIAQSWGQVWTKPKWEKFKEWYYNNSNFIKSDDIPAYLNEWPESSWLKYHDRYCIETNRYFVYPYVSLSTNCSDAGTHANSTTNDHQVELQFDKTDYSFPDFGEGAIKYDEYMNPEGLAFYLGVPDTELTVDFYGTKNKKSYRRYLLTCLCFDYKIVDKFSLSLRPLEASVILKLHGDGIYLYDTSIDEKNKSQCDSLYQLQLYSLRTHDWRVMLPLSVKMTIHEIKNSVARKIKKCMKIKK